jgi:hypothetical protein
MVMCFSITHAPAPRAAAGNKYARAAVGVVGVADRSAEPLPQQSERAQVRIGGRGGKRLKAVHQNQARSAVGIEYLDALGDFVHRRGAGGEHNR